jgi:hypothetical protein
LVFLLRTFHRSLFDPLAIDNSLVDLPLHRG